jgi:hypothetical protein
MRPLLNGGTLGGPMGGADSIIARLRERAGDRTRPNGNAERFPRASPPPVSTASMAEAEAALRHSLPPLLRDAYLLVGDGVFGPGYGLLPLLTNDTHPGETVVQLYAAFTTTDPDDASWAWPTNLLPFCDWGCAIRSCVDTSSPDGAVLTFDPGARGPDQPMSLAFAQTHSSLRQWFSDWLDGIDIWKVMYEPDPARTRIGINPFTKEKIEIPAYKLRRL